MVALTFTVYGTPAPQGSHRAFAMKGGKGARVTESNPNVGPWRERVMYAAMYALPHNWTPLTGPLAVTLVFHLPRPSSAPKTRDIYPAKKPDIEKLVRAVHDSCTDAGVWLDDGQVVSLRVDKVYAVGPHLARIYNPEIHIAAPQVAVHIATVD